MIPSKMPHPQYDIAVVGLGPAGATLARLLDPHFSVIAIDKKRADSENGFRKPCGGLLAPDAQKSLARFDLTLPLEVMVNPQIFSVLTIDADSGIRRRYQRHYLNLDRHAFDRWLISLLPENVDVREGSQCTAMEKGASGYVLSWRERNGAHSATVKYVVGADGAASFVRRTLAPGFKTRKYVAIQQWFADTHPSPFYSCIFDSEMTDCYAWGLTKNEHFIFGGAFEPRQARNKFEQLKAAMRDQGFHLGAPLRTEACIVLRPQYPTHMTVGKNGFFLLGEAAGFISPSSLEGLSYALESARKLADILNTGTPHPNRAYFLATLGLRAKLLLKSAKAFALFSPAIRRLIMKSGLSAID